MSRQQLMQPAIALARKGYVLRQGDVNILHTRSDDFAASPNVAAIFLDNGQPYRVGETLKQPQLARTLRSEEHTSEHQSLMRIPYAVSCLKKKKQNTHKH